MSRRTWSKTGSGSRACTIWKSVDVSDVRKKLNVENVLEGSLRREGNRVRITAQLIDTRNGFHLWSETYERELQGVFPLQDEITLSIVDALKIKLAVSLPAHEQRSTEALSLIHISEPTRLLSISYAV